MGVRRLVSLFLTVLLAACGGSGSSGFDVTPGGLEAPLIERAIAENRCVEGDGLLICPSGVPAPGPDNGMNVPGPSEVRVEAGFSGESGCDASGSCTLPIAVSTDGLPPDSQVRVAVRSSGSAEWQVGEPLDVQPSDAGEGTLTPVDVEVAGTTDPGSEVQVAVLVFVPPLGPVPSQVKELRETGASYAFVLPPVALTPGASS